MMHSITYTYFMKNKKKLLSIAFEDNSHLKYILYEICVVTEFD